MKCLLCSSWSFQHICKACQKESLKPSLYKRKIRGNIDVYSFYKYKEIEKLLHTKHKDLGYYIYSILADKAFKHFTQNFTFEERVAAVAIDDKVDSGYAHTAILTHALTSSSIQPFSNTLRASSTHNYSSQSFQYRLLHPRNFTLKAFEPHFVILVDDILTTGLTLTQAVDCIEKEGKEVLFCLTLADAQK